MKILHLYSNWKWTGPAQHALSLAVQLRTAGHDVRFACAAPPEGVPESIVAAAGQAGMEPLTRFRLNKHFSLTANIGDATALRRYLKIEKFDVVHTHLSNDHLLAGLALRTALGRTALIRTCYDGDGVPSGFRTRLLLSLMTDGLITISERTRQQVMHRRYLPPARIWKVDVPVDLKKFDCSRIAGSRLKYGLSEEAIVGGIVARVQKHRRFGVLLRALQIVINEFPGFRFMIIGRGTHIEEIALRPSQKMRIRSNLIFTGYMNADYVETLKCLNFKIFLVPGTDGACRAVREAMALGIPVIAANRGMLPEIVTHGHDGLIVEDTPEALASAIMQLVEQPELRRQMAANALQKARAHFDLEVQTKKIEAIYSQVLSGRRPAG